MKLSVVYEDNNILVIDKPSGIVVNRSTTSKGDTLQDQITRHLHLKDLGIGDRVGIVHRLDKGTSGLVVVAKKKKVFDFLQNQFKLREVNKEYLALVHGRVGTSMGVISANIGRIGKFGKFGVVKEGRDALTEYKVEKRFSVDDARIKILAKDFNLNKNRINYLKSNAREYTLLKIKPKTGRTHQIRVHLKSIAAPVVSDSLYTPSKLVKFDLSWCPRLFLHASKLEFKVSKSKEPLEFALDLPKDLKSAILSLS